MDNISKDFKLKMKITEEDLNRNLNGMELTIARLFYVYGRRVEITSQNTRSKSNG